MAPIFLILGSLLCWITTNVASYEKLPFLLKPPLLRPPSTGCFSQNYRTKNGVTVLEMKHAGYCFGRRHKPQASLIADQARVKFIQSQIANADESPRIPIISGLALQTMNYVVTIALGGRKLTVIVDTGSDLTWVQCQPCNLCYSQTEPLFDPAGSPSYQRIGCGSPTCRILQNATGNSGLCGGANSCKYAVTYGDGSYTRGELGSDHAVLGGAVVDWFTFGCGRSNRGLFGSAAGLMGLGKSDLSLVSQTYGLFGGVFSYCLPSTVASGALVFGRDASVYRNDTPVIYTRLGINPQLSSFYTVNLTGVTVGGVGVQSPGFGRSGVMIDSGTVITRFPPSIYGAFRAEFLRQFSGYPRAQGFSILDTCFDLSAYEEVSLPAVRLLFEGGAGLSVDAGGVVYVAREDASQVCLAVVSLEYEGEIGIIGNYQQRNTRVVYDTDQMRIGFAKETCTFV